MKSLALQRPFKLVEAAGAATKEAVKALAAAVELVAEEELLVEAVQVPLAQVLAMAALARALAREEGAVTAAQRVRAQAPTRIREIAT